MASKRIEESEFQRMLKKAVKVVRYLEVHGESRRGVTTKRNGKVVSCGHRHRTQAAAKKCEARMRLDRPGNCQTYRVASIVALAIPKKQESPHAPQD